MKKPESFPGNLDTPEQDSAWGESYTKDLPPFAGAREAGNPTLEEKPTPGELEKRSITLMREALRAETFDPKEQFQMIQDYAEMRAARLGVERPVNVFLRYEDFVKTANGSTRRKTRFSPATSDVYRGENWGWDTRAFHSDDGTFLDFCATPDRESSKPLEEQTGKLTGYERAYELVSFLYTCEHELQHDIQDQKIEKKEISYDALRIAKDRVAIFHILPHLKDGEYFYANTHDDLYIEDDANQTASEFLYNAIPTDGSLARQIVNPNDPPEYQHDLLSVCLSREREGQTHHKEYTYELPENQIGLSPKTYQGSAEEIVSDICDDAVAIFPAFLKTYPVLALEYHDDGTRRSLDELQQAMKNLPTDGEQIIGGQKVEAKRLRVAYHRIIKNLRKKEEEDE